MYQFVQMASATNPLLKMVSANTTPVPAVGTYPQSALAAAAAAAAARAYNIAPMTNNLSVLPTGATSAAYGLPAR